jgi:hypothetical protein
LLWYFPQFVQFLGRTDEEPTYLTHNFAFLSVRAGTALGHKPRSVNLTALLDGVGVDHEDISR